MSDIQSGDRVRITGACPHQGKTGKVGMTSSLSLYAFGSMRKAVVSLDESDYSPELPVSALTKIDTDQ